MATAGLKSNKVIVTLGGSCSSSLVEDIDPVKGFGSILSRMLNSYFDTEFVLSCDPKPGEVPYKIMALQLNESILVDTFDEDFNKFDQLQPKKVEGRSPLFDYGRTYSDVYWDYYFIDALGDVIELSFNVAQILLENGSNVASSVDFAEPAISVIPEILASTDAPISVVSEAAASVPDVDGDALGWFGDLFGGIGDMFSGMFDSCSVPDCDVPDCGGLDCGGVDCSS